MRERRRYLCSRHVQVPPPLRHRHEPRVAGARWTWGRLYLDAYQPQAQLYPSRREAVLATTGPTGLLQPPQVSSPAAHRRVVSVASS